jgi:hypothetical protein
MDGHDQMTSARPSTSRRHRQSHRVWVEGWQKVQCFVMMMTAGCARDWNQRLHQLRCGFARQSTAHDHETGREYCRPRRLRNGAVT